MLLPSSHRQILLHLDMAMTTNPNPTVILADTTRATKYLEATTAIIKEAIKVSRAMVKTKGMETISTKVIPSRLHHQFQQCITTRVDHTTMDITPSSHNHSSNKSRTTTAATIRALEATMLGLRASNQLLKDTMDKHRHSINQSSNTTQVVITKTPQDQEATQTGKTQASNQI